jgi:hypothetical protein
VWAAEVLGLVLAREACDRMLARKKRPRGCHGAWLALLLLWVRNRLLSSVCFAKVPLIMKRVPRQAPLPFWRSSRVLLRRWREREQGKKMKPGLGRPKKAGGAGASHASRPELGEKSAVHVTLRLRRGVGGLRNRKRYAEVKRAFVAAKDSGLRLIHYAVLGNHLHALVEVDSKVALSKGVQKLALCLSRRLNAQSVRAEGGNSQGVRGRALREQPGWIGPIFAERFDAHYLESKSELERAVRYVVTNAEHHGFAAPRTVDFYCSLHPEASTLLDKPRSGLLKMLARPPP